MIEMNVWAWGFVFWIGYHIVPKITLAVATVWILVALGVIP